MRFPRRARLLRNPFDATAYAGVFLLLVLFISLSSRLYTPEVRIELPTGGETPGSDKPTVRVALDEAGRYFFKDKLIEEEELKRQFTNAVAQSAGTPTLLVYADKKVRQENMIHLVMIASDAGIRPALQVTLPRAIAPPARP